MSNSTTITTEEAAKISQSTLVGSKKLIEDIKSVTKKARCGNKKSKKKSKK